MADDANDIAPTLSRPNTPFRSVPPARAVPLAALPGEVLSPALQRHGTDQFHAIIESAMPGFPHAAPARCAEAAVITFADSTSPLLVARTLETTRIEAERADRASLRIFSAVSREINQRMEALILLQQLLRETIESEKACQLLAQLEHKLLTLSGLLATLIDRDRFEADSAETGIAISPMTDALSLARAAQAPAVYEPARPQQIAYIVDDNAQIRLALKELLEGHGLSVAVFASAEAFLASYQPGSEGCLLLDAHLPGMDGLALLGTLRERGDHLPTILISGSHDMTLAVDAMRGGACDFLEKPVGRRDLLASITRAIDGSHDIRMVDAAQENAAGCVAGLTARQREIMLMVLAGHPSKNIAADLGISQRTVENHRAAVMQKMHVKSLPELTRKVQAAEAHPVGHLARKAPAAPLADAGLYS